MQKSLRNYFISLTLSIFILTFSGTAVLAQNLDLNDQTASQVGQRVTFTVSIVDAPTSLEAFGFTVTFDPNVLAFVGATKGNLVQNAFFDANAQDGAITAGGFTIGQISKFDVDGNGEVDALTDGLLTIRYLFGFRSDTLVAGAVNTANCTRCTAADIETFIQFSFEPIPMGTSGEIVQLEFEVLSLNATTLTITEAFDDFDQAGWILGDGQFTPQ